MRFTDDTLLTTRQVAAITGWSESKLCHDRVTGQGIPFVRVSGRSIRYKGGAVREYLDNLPVFTRTDQYE